MEKIDKFLNWFSSIGGGVITPGRVEELKPKFLNEPRPNGTLKARAKNIKLVHNYVFRHKFLENEPNIETLKFDKK